MARECDRTIEKRVCEWSMYCKWAVVCVRGDGQRDVAVLCGMSVVGYCSGWMCQLFLFFGSTVTVVCRGVTGFSLCFRAELTSTSEPERTAYIHM